MHPAFSIYITTQEKVATLLNMDLFCTIFILYEDYIATGSKQYIYDAKRSLLTLVSMELPRCKEENKRVILLSWRGLLMTFRLTHSLVSPAVLDKFSYDKLIKKIKHDKEPQTSVIYNVYFNLKREANDLSSYFRQ